MKRSSHASHEWNAVRRSGGRREDTGRLAAHIGGGSAMDGTFSLTAVGEGKAPGPNGAITAIEEKELQRVFDRLCDYKERTRIENEIKDLEAWLAKTKTNVAAQASKGVTINTERVDAGNQSTRERIDALRAEIVALETRPDKKISCIDVTEMLKELKQKIIKKDIEEMVWEGKILIVYCTGSIRA